MLTVRQFVVGELVRRPGRLLVALALATGAMVIAVSSPASAGPVTYAFNPGSTTTLGGTVYAISGVFTVTTTAYPGYIDTVSDGMALTLSGTGSLAATYTGTGFNCELPDTSCIATFVGSPGLSNEVIVYFADPLSDSIDPPTNVAIVLAGSSVFSPSDFSRAGSVSPVPEAASLALLGTAFGVLKCQPRRGREKRQ
jgi:hypothetical protein